MEVFVYWFRAPRVNLSVKLWQCVDYVYGCCNQCPVVHCSLFPSVLGILSLRSVWMLSSIKVTGDSYLILYTNFIIPIPILSYQFYRMFCGNFFCLIESYNLFVCVRFECWVANYLFWHYAQILDSHYIIRMNLLVFTLVL